MHDQRGARWLAREQREIVAAALPELREGGGDPVEHSDQQRPPRYPLSDCMCDRALMDWCEVLAEYGLMPTEMV